MPLYTFVALALFSTFPTICFENPISTRLKDGIRCWFLDLTAPGGL
jgi:hypothetical protein